MDFCDNDKGSVDIDSWSLAELKDVLFFVCRSSIGSLNSKIEKKLGIMIMDGPITKVQAIIIIRPKIIIRVIKFLITGATLFNQFKCRKIIAKIQH
jgi:hypothetical protein